MNRYAPIAEHGIIGDLQTAALDAGPMWLIRSGRVFRIGCEFGQW
ncbi:hypothetical protein [Streptomyces sp. BP-8]|uniref:Uncharacterized protein n=1 Tax=Streptomyces sirii TaxID=3127701 RepID=A0ABZ2QME7_9ACTN